MLLFSSSYPTWPGEVNIISVSSNRSCSFTVWCFASKCLSHPSSPMQAFSLMSPISLLADLWTVFRGISTQGFLLLKFYGQNLWTKEYIDKWRHFDYGKILKDASTCSLDGIVLIWVLDMNYWDRGPSTDCHIELLITLFKCLSLPSGFSLILLTSTL